MPTFFLFVYGTLKRGASENTLLAGQQFLREAQTLPRYRLYDRGVYPALVEAATDGRAIRGEIWQVSESLLPSLESYEDAPRTFRRQPIAIENWEEPIFAYFYQGPIDQLREGGSEWVIPSG